MIGIAALLCLHLGQTRWQRIVTIDPAGIRTEQQFNDELKRQGVPFAGYANWFTGRWPNISFIGGMAMGNVSEDLEFFYQKPFRWSNRVLDYVMEGGGRKFGIRATIRPYKNQGVFPGRRSYLIWYRCDKLLADYHPSYILVNGRRVWDSKIHPLLDGKIMAPFWQDEPGDPVVDFVVDLDYTPDVEGLALRMFNTQNIGPVGVKVSLKGASDQEEPSPADSEERFAFGVFPSTYDFWSDKGTLIAEIEKSWKPNFRPSYPTDNVSLSPFIDASAAHGPYHRFMVTYGGCNVLGANPDAAILQETNGYARAVLADENDPESAKKVLSLDPKLDVDWFGGEGGLLAPDDAARRVADLIREREAVRADKERTGSPDRVRSIYEPFPPALTSAYEYERGRDVLVLKNEEDPQYNILMAMGRGAGHSFGKPFGFYWEQTHYPFPSLDFKLQACLLYYFSGASWIGAEAENAPSFADGTVAEWVMPYVQALRFAMVHPARGTPVVPIAICWTDGDRWWAPYNPFGQMDTFQRAISYDHATKTFTCEPEFVKPLPWMPSDRRTWDFDNSAHLGYFFDAVPELRGYDLLDVFFPKYGDAFTARISRLLTGTPFGPLDFVDFGQVSASTLKTYRVAAFLGHATIDASAKQKLLAAAQSGQSILLGAQHLLGGEDLLGLRVTGDPVQVSGKIEGLPGISGGRFSGLLFQPGFNSQIQNPKSKVEFGWQTVAWVGTSNVPTPNGLTPNASPPNSPLVVSRKVGKGTIYVYLGRWIADGGDVLRPLLAALGERAEPLRLASKDDQIEYVAYRKGSGAWVAVFNHGAIPVGCDRLKAPRAIAPEPLCSTVKGPLHDEFRFRLANLGLDPSRRYALYEVEGIDGPHFEKVIAGTESFKIRQVPARLEDGDLRAMVTIGKRAEFVVAPPGQGARVFFGASGGDGIRT